MSIREAALELIRDSAHHTTHSNAVDAAGNACAGSTPQAVAWSVLGAVNRVTVLHFNTLEHMGEWRSTTSALLEAGASHSTSHAESLRLLAA